MKFPYDIYRIDKSNLNFPAAGGSDDPMECILDQQLAANPETNGVHLPHSHWSVHREWGPLRADHPNGCDTGDPASTANRAAGTTDGMGPAATPAFAKLGWL